MDCLYLHHAQSFSFGSENLAQKIVQESDFSLTGCWHYDHQKIPHAESQTVSSWYLYLSRGKVIFSEERPLSISSLMAVAERYVPRLRSRKTKQLAASLLSQQVPGVYDHPLEALPTLLRGLYQLDVVKPAEIERALRLKILEDFDAILFDCSGQANFLPNGDLSTHFPFVGFSLQELVSEAHRRKLIWSKVKILIPSTDSQIKINENAIRTANLAHNHEAHIRKLISYGGTLKTISATLGQDTLEIAKGSAQLVNKGLLTVQTLAKQGDEVWIIDDSPQMLLQFQRLVAGWGYKVQSHSDPASAIGAMVQSNPMAVFIDINMPKLSGFDLLKQIRRQPSLAEIPLIMLTAERTLSNNWKAQWSGCDFLSKPLRTDEIPQFKQNLRRLLKNISL